MEDHDRISQYDLVEIIQVPEKLQGVIDIGDTGVVVEKYDEKTFVIECLQPGGSSKWLKPLSSKYIRLKSKDPFSVWAQKTLAEKSIARPSMILGTLIGAVCGALIGGGMGAITRSFDGILIGLVIGLILGTVTGALSAALTVKIAGTTGGIGVGFYTGMLAGGFFGTFVGALIPPAWLMGAHTEGLPMLDALMMGRFETAMLIGFLLSTLGTIVGVWIGGKNEVPISSKERYR